MNTLCTFYDPTTGAIDGDGEVSEDTLEGYFQTGHAVRLDVLGDADTHYIDTDTLELIPYTVDEVAAKRGLRKGWIWKMPDRIAVDMRPLATARQQAWARIKAARDVAELSPFDCDGRIYDADEKATRRISGATNGAMMAAMNGQPFSIEFTLADNTSAVLTGAEMMAVGATLIARVGAVFDTARTLRDAIEAVPEESPTANAQLDAINWPSQEP